MCAVSAVGDYRVEPRKWPAHYPVPSAPIPTVPVEQLTREDVNNLIKAYLEAHNYDVANNEEKCHKPEKHQELKEILENLKGEFLSIVQKGNYSEAREVFELISDTARLIDLLES